MGWGQPGLDGYWKGQLVEETGPGQGSSLEAWKNGRPRRILMRLEEDAGVVQGAFAPSYDMIAFRQIDDERSRRVATFAVTGAIDGSRVRFRFSGEAGRSYEVEAVVGEDVIAGTYIARHPADGTNETTSGRFEIERY